MGIFAPAKTLFARRVLALAKVLVLTSCAPDKMLFLATLSLKEMFLESSLQREDVQIDYNTCSRARYLCELDFYLFISSPWLPFRLLPLQWWCWCTALWILKYCSASKCRPPSSFCFPQLLTDSNLLTLLQVCIIHPFSPGFSPESWKVAYALLLTPLVRVWHHWAWDVPEEGPMAKAIWRGLLCILFWWQGADQKRHNLAKYTLTKWAGEGKEITGWVT